jgi:hypothetical protein
MFKCLITQASAWLILDLLDRFLGLPVWHLVRYRLFQSNVSFNQPIVSIFENLLDVSILLNFQGCFTICLSSCSLPTLFCVSELYIITQFLSCQQVFFSFFLVFLVFLLPYIMRQFHSDYPSCNVDSFRCYVKMQKV